MLMRRISPEAAGGDGYWFVYVPDNTSGFVPIGSGPPRLWLAAIDGLPLTDIDRIRLGISGLGAFAALWAWLGGRAADPERLAQWPWASG